VWYAGCEVLSIPARSCTTKNGGEELALFGFWKIKI
jgi:hypothetical protein